MDFSTDPVGTPAEPCRNPSATPKNPNLTQVKPNIKTYITLEFPRFIGEIGKNCYHFASEIRIIHK